MSVLGMPFSVTRSAFTLVVIQVSEVDLFWRASCCAFGFVDVVSLGRAASHQAVSRNGGYAFDFLGRLLQQ